MTTNTPQPIIESTAIRDHLAAEKTLLAYERTFLAYVRTALACLMSGLTLLHFFRDGIFLTLISWILIFSGITFFVWGILRYHSIKSPKKVA